ncbi:MAG: FG-GAP-like repeat-containing protein [Chloroflexi bacterium]|nr:FG-GAP-like repeat-containing protein [Chloroflexota bacterium]
MRRLPLLLALLTLLLAVRGTAAQSDPTPTYWRYDARGQLDHVVVADLDGNGIDEFVVVAQEYNLTLIGTDGVPQWGPFQTQEPIMQVSTAAVDDTPQREIIIGTRNQLILLRHDGQLLWQKSLPPPSASGTAENLADTDWRRLGANPLVVLPFDDDNDGHEDILVAVRTGQLLLYSGQTGDLRWSYIGNQPPAYNALTQVAVADFTQDGLPDIAFAYFTERSFTELIVLDNQSRPLWRHSLSGRVTNLTPISYAEGEMNLAVSTSRGIVHLYEGVTGTQRWYRTPNVEVTHMAVAYLPEQPVLVLGTAVGTLLAYNAQGRRLWDRTFSTTARQRVTDISTSPQPDPEGKQPVRLLVTLETTRPTRAEPAEVLLLDSNGRALDRYSSASTLGLSQLLDINRDGHDEVLLATFSTLSLLDSGLSSDARRYATDWAYRLEARPRTVLAVDLDDDGRQELLVGSDDGRLHYILPEGTTPVGWPLIFGGLVSHVAITPPDSTGEQLIAVVHNNSFLATNGVETVEGWLELIRPDGRPLWPTPIRLETAITSLLVADINNAGRAEIVVGTRDGQLITYSLAGQEFWRATVEGGVRDLHLIHNDPESLPKIVATTEADKLYLFNIKGGIDGQVEYVVDIQGVLGLGRDPSAELSSPRNTAEMLVITQDGQLRGLTLDGVLRPEWRATLEQIPTLAIGAGQSALVATADAHVVRLSMAVANPLQLLWERELPGRISYLHWGDLDGDVRPDVGVGTADGLVALYDSDGRQWADLSLGSSIFYLAPLVAPEQTHLAVVTDNGVVQRLSTQANRPPLLLNPQTDVGENRYTISITVLDVERDAVNVNLLLHEADSDEWLPQGERVATRGTDTLFWSIPVPQANLPVRYRFDYSDSIYTGTVEPASGPAPNLPAAWGERSLVLGMGALVVVAALLARQVQLAGWRTGSFYKQLRTRPRETLILLETEYARQLGSPDFLLNLANRARRDRNGWIINLADGLYLLADRPTTGLDIFLDVLEDVHEKQGNWWGLGAWMGLFKTALELLEAPSLMELTLLRPRLVQLINSLERGGLSAEAFEGLLPILTSLRDCNRVARAEDRLVYLQEAAVLLRQQQLLLEERPMAIKNTIALALLARWGGLVSAAVEDVRGRAWLSATLKTRRVIPAAQVAIALELENSGRAAGENVRVRLLEDPAAFEIITGETTIPVLAGGRQRTVSLAIRPQGLDAIRLVFEVSYEDATLRPHQFEFADMVHILPPVREFTPLVNPYSPGTPLRKTSNLFFGRQSLLNFIIHNVERSQQSQQPSVLILVGQRRTGKTSALLRLDEYAPPNLLPVYVDCQSFGVAEGMTAFLYDLAWFIADALATRQYEVVVPPMSAWRENPSSFFQREFLPAVFALLPAEARLLLVFDEFEAFENLVNDGILPPTLFPFLRHLMQHGQRLNFVFAGTHRLEEMGTDYWSILFNIALYQQVEYLEESAARDLICKPVAPHIVYDDLALDKILRVTAGHPYFLQLVCYALVNRANEQGTGYVTISDVDVALKEMLRLGEVHFAYLWQQSTAAEKQLLTAVAHLHDNEGAFQPATLINSLEAYNVYVEPPAALEALQRLVERGIMRQVVAEGVVAYELRVGLVGLWTAQNKGLGELYQDGRRRQLAGVGV